MNEQWADEAARTSGPTPHAPSGWIDLFWIPLGAGGSGFVRLVGKVYEAWKSFRDRRKPLALYHTALQVGTPDGVFVLEMMLPSPGGDTTSRGVVQVGPVASAWLAKLAMFRYEVRRWRDGILFDTEPGVFGPHRVSEDPGQAARLLELMDHIPHLVWGRDQASTGEMWNSNSVVSWLLANAGLPVESIEAPPGGRAPGWDAGIVLARRHRPSHLGEQL